MSIWVHPDFSWLEPFIKWFDPYGRADHLMLLAVVPHDCVQALVVCCGVSVNAYHRRNINACTAIMV